MVWKYEGYQLWAKKADISATNHVVRDQPVAVQTTEILATDRQRKEHDRPGSEQVFSITQLGGRYLQRKYSG